MRTRDAYSFRCDGCRAEVEVPVHLTGARLVCPHCGARFAYSWPGPTDDPPCDLRAVRTWEAA